jgi:hypothetical protein
MFNKISSLITDMRLHSWLMHYATSREVMDSSVDEAIRFISLPNHSSRTAALESIQPLRAMNTKSLPEG